MIGVFLVNSGGDIRFLPTMTVRLGSSSVSRKMSRRFRTNTQIEKLFVMKMFSIHGSHRVFGLCECWIGRSRMKVSFLRSSIQLKSSRQDMILSSFG